MTTQSAAASPSDAGAYRVSHEVQAYEHGHSPPLGGYAAILAAFAGSVAAAVVSGRLSGRRPPKRYAIADVVLGGIATHKFARIVTKDVVVSPVRVPFTRFDKPTGSGEVSESPRDGSDLRQAVGQLLSCPFCLAPWIATGYVAALALAPRAARSWAAAMSTVAISDVLQHLYARVRTD